MKRSEIFFGLIRIPIDFALALAAFRLAYFLRSEGHFMLVKEADLGTFPPLAEFLRVSVYGALLLLVVFAFLNTYSLRSTVSFGREARRVIAGVAIWLMAAISYYFLVREFPFSRLVLVYSWLFATIFLLLGRGVLRAIQTTFLKAGIGNRRVIIFGIGKIAEEIMSALMKSRIYAVVGHTGSMEELEKMMRGKNCDELIQTGKGKSEEILAFCREHHLVYHFVPDVLEVSRTNLEVRTVSGIPIISLKPTPLDGWGKVSKRAFDLFGSTLGLVILSPFFLVIAIAIKINSRGPVFFTYGDDKDKKVLRVGQKGTLFGCVKFRTMKKNDHFVRYSEGYQKNNTRQDSPLVKIHNDPRVTGVGKFLRKYSIDELPQLWNVLKGEMSLVGPRPHLKEEVEKYQTQHRFVLTLKPGITGLAQISGRSDLPFEKEIRLDTFYIEHWSLWLDVKILLKTIYVVLKGHKE